MLISIIFTTPKRWTLMSSIIKWFTKSDVSHVAISKVYINDTQLILGANSNGVTFDVRNKFEKTDKIVEEYLIEVTKEQLNHAIKHLNEKYDFTGVFGFGLMILAFRWFKLKIKKPFVSQKAMWCSEFVLSLNYDKQIEQWNNLIPEDSTAEDVRKACSSFIKIK